MKRKLILFNILILCIFLFSCSDENFTENNESFDPYGIAYLNNGDNVNFSQYQNVLLTGEENSRYDDNNKNGIINAIWNSSGTPYDVENGWYMFSTICNQSLFNFKVPSEGPFFIHNLGEKEDYNYEQGTFVLFKANNDFCVKITKTGLYDFLTDELITPLSETVTYKYFVTSNKLVLLN